MVISIDKHQYLPNFTLKAFEKLDSFISELILPTLQVDNNLDLQQIVMNIKAEKYKSVTH